MKAVKVTIKIPKVLFRSILADLKRSHPFAYERVGFIMAKHKRYNDGEILVFMIDYLLLNDDHYIEDPTVGARINSNAIREALQLSLDQDVGIFHVHHHLTSTDLPGFSEGDMIDNPEIVKSFSYAQKDLIHGMMVLSDNGLNVSILLPGGNELIQIDKTVIVGSPMNFSYITQINEIFEPETYDRQSFLGKNSQFLLSKVKVGIVGLGGGGSHIVQQLAHIGVMDYVVYDPDITKKHNLNRNVGTCFDDVKKRKLKVEVAERVIKKIVPDAQIKKLPYDWKTQPEPIQKCDIVFGCVDSFLERSYLEAECRRYLIPLIDIGMDVHHDFKTEPPSMSGQIIASIPGQPCFKCLGFLTDDHLQKEATNYGDAGGRPQVVWSNGILASTAVGIFVNLITGWTEKKDRLLYYSYDGNKGDLTEHQRLKFCDIQHCHHYHLKHVGPSNFKEL